VVAPWLKRLGDSWQVMNPAASITMEIPAALNGYEVIGDVSLERALVNALDNALNAGAIKVVLSASLDQQQLLLTIEDDGSGISPEAVAAFEAGQPVASAKGMGVGLLLARAAIERHGGSFEITAMADRGVQGNRGTRVKIMLPVIVSPENPA
jgi:signal transduction histidine kinase